VVFQKEYIMRCSYAELNC